MTRACKRIWKIVTNVGQRALGFFDDNSTGNCIKLQQILTTNRSCDTVLQGNENS